MSDFKENLIELAKEPLLQHGQLRAAPEIKDPAKVSPDLLATWLSFAQSYCDSQGFQCLAFTQLKEPVREALGFDAELPPRVIFNRLSMQEKGSLVVNPKIEVICGENDIPTPNFERCGSIENKNLPCFIYRPTATVLGGYFFDGAGLDYGYREVENAEWTDMSVHEVAHLDGKTALSTPDLICDQDFIKNWEVLKKWFGIYTEEAFRDFIKKVTPMGILVYDHEEKKFSIVDAYGNYLREYTHLN